MFYQAGINKKFIGGNMKAANIFLAFALMLSSAGTSTAQEPVDARRMKAKKIADELIDMRSKRAASLISSDKVVTPELFKEVCGVVKKRAMALAGGNNVRIRHAAIKNRNPDHAATDEERKLHSLFDADRTATHVWDDVEIEGKAYGRYVRPIFVEPACLACHGEKDSRPEFIQKKYPGDRAFGFKVGDLRGIIEVMTPKN